MPRGLRQAPLATLEWLPAAWYTSVLSRLAWMTTSWWSAQSPMPSRIARASGRGNQIDHGVNRVAHATGETQL